MSFYCRAAISGIILLGGLVTVRSKRPKGLKAVTKLSIVISSEIACLISEPSSNHLILHAPLSKSG